MTHRAYVFTSFDIDLRDKWLNSPNEKIRYMVFQLERSPTTNRDHLQGYLELKAPARLKQIKEILGSDQIHLEIRHGKREQAIAYCKKDDTRIEGPWEIGNPNIVQGYRSDLVSVKTAIDGGMPNSEIADEFFSQWVRYRNSFEMYRNLKLNVKRDSSIDPSIFVLFGPTGCGKTRTANETFPNAFWMRKPAQNAQIWWDGYQGQTVVIIDEFYGWLPWDFLLRLLDRYPLTFDVKGGTVECLAHTFVITSNRAPEDWYPKIDDKSPLMRRLTHIFEFESNGNTIIIK
nr:MAG: replication associated protein [Cressdnaviricota sp.]